MPRHAIDSASIVEKVFSGGREHRSAGLAAEQFAIEADLQPFDLVADCGLRKPQHDGCLGDAAMLADRRKRPQCVNFQSSPVDFVHGYLRSNPCELHYHIHFTA